MPTLPSIYFGWWWLLVLVGFPFVGRLWCSICPFMIYGEVAQRLSLRWFPRELLPGRVSRQKVGRLVFVWLFALILLWEELWHLENTALSVGLPAAVDYGRAMIFSVLFERRFLVPLSLSDRRHERHVWQASHD